MEPTNTDHISHTNLPTDLPTDLPPVGKNGDASQPIAERVKYLINAAPRPALPLSGLQTDDPHASDNADKPTPQHGSIGNRMKNYVLTPIKKSLSNWDKAGKAGKAAIAARVGLQAIVLGMGSVGVALMAPAAVMKEDYSQQQDPYAKADAAAWGIVLTSIPAIAGGVIAGFCGALGGHERSLDSTINFIFFTEKKGDDQLRIAEPKDQLDSSRFHIGKHNKKVSIVKMQNILGEEGLKKLANSKIPIEETDIKNGFNRISSARDSFMERGSNGDLVAGIRLLGGQLERYKGREEKLRTLKVGEISAADYAEHILQDRRLARTLRSLEKTPST